MQKYKSIRADLPSSLQGFTVKIAILPVFHLFVVYKSSWLWGMKFSIQNFLCDYTHI